jgi:hypothetical protein
MERSCLHISHTEIPQPAAHFRCRPCREGYGQKPLRTVDTGVHSIGDPVRDGTGFSSSGPCKNTQRTVQRTGDFALLVIEAAKNALLQGAAFKGSCCV